MMFNANFFFIFFSSKPVKNEAYDLHHISLMTEIKECLLSGAWMDEWDG